MGNNYSSVQDLEERNLSAMSVANWGQKWVDFSFEGSFLFSCPSSQLSRKNVVAEISIVLVRYWYFVTKLFLTYCEKNCFSDQEKLLKFKAEGREFAKFCKFKQIFTYICTFGFGFGIPPKARCFSGQIFGFGLK